MKKSVLMLAGVRALAALTVAALLSCAVARAENSDTDDPTEKLAVVMQLVRPDQPLDTRAPATQFIPSDGEKVWRLAKDRALAKPAGRSGGIFDFNVIPESFKSATNFYNEQFVPGDLTENLTVVLTAAEARRNGKKLELTQMQMVYFIPETPASKTKPGSPPAPGKTPKARGNTKTSTPKPGEKKGKEKPKPGDPAAPASPMAMPGGGRLVITAPKCEIDLETNEGYASGGASIEVFPKPEPGKELKSTAKLFSLFLRWRSWNEAATGSTEIVMYTCSNDPNEADPEVWGNFTIPQPVGPDSEMKIRGRGMIFESGQYDRPTPVYDEDGRTAGTSLAAHSKAFFHSHISTEMTATAITALMPFQGDPNAGKDPAKKDDKKGEKKSGKKKQAAEPEPYKTVVSCEGPAIFDMAYVPRTVVSTVVEKEVKATAIELEPQPMDMGKRFEFLNQVSLVKTPLKEKPPEPGAPDMATHMSCGHLRIEYPPNSMPSMSSFPNYAECIGGVKMFGYKEPEQPAPAEPGQPPPPPLPPEPFSIECERMYLDGPGDNMFLVGGEDPAAPEEKLAHVKYTSGAAFAQQFCFRKKTQTLTMPSQGRKKMIIHPVAPPNAAAPVVKTDATAPNSPPTTPPASTGMLGGGDTYLSWTGPLARELRHLPTKGKRDVLKEVLTLNKDVVIEQPESGLKMYGETIRIYSDALTKQVEYLYAENDVDIYMHDTLTNTDLQARGYIVTVDMATDEKGVEIKKLITIVGNRKLGIKADVFKGGGNAVRSDKLIIDQLTNNFMSYGGTVAVVKGDPQPATPPPSSSDPKPPEVAGANAVVSSIKFDTGGDIFIQCDGPFSQNAQTHIVNAEGNVLIRQTGLTLMSTKIKITMDDAPPAPADPNAPKKPGDPKATPDSKDPKIARTSPNGSERTPPAKPPTTAQSGAPAAPGTPPPTTDFFSGGLKTLECFGMVELVMDDKLIHCDTLKFDGKEESAQFDVDDAEDDVRIYNHGEDGSDKVLCARKSLLLDQKTGMFTPGGQMLILPFKASAPFPRGRDNSPSRKAAK